ncbi:3-oxoacyl-reductase [Xylariaceae sp. FL0016]|nr:3-oxoacyl-reductase [Xylariaceae sp. FL0016]
MTSLLRGSALITGAASGIGQRTALCFAKYGIQRLALADINKGLLTSSINTLRSQYPTVDVVPLEMDVRDISQVRSGIADVAQRFGRLDVAVNNAGVGGSGKNTDAVEEEEWASVLDVNLHGVWRCQREELRVMMRQDDRGPREGRGRIINISSMLGLVGTAEGMSHTAYCTSKHGVIGLTRADATTYGAMGIRINAICPGYVATPLTSHYSESNPDSPLARDIKQTPLKRLADVEEIGDAITLLASPMTSFMQGAAMVIDGGFTVQ